jgi:hypothetical protein
MIQATPRFRLRLRFPLWALLALPVACAPLFLWLAMTSRVAQEPQVSIWERWMYHPDREFPIKDGDLVGQGGILAHVAFVGGPHGLLDQYSRWFYTLNPDGMLDCDVYTGSDRWLDPKPVPPGLLARLPALLQKLPPSDQSVDPGNRVVVAFAGNSRWFVRSYRHPGPKEVGDLMSAMRPPDDPPGK